MNFRKARRRMREARMVAEALKSSRHPILAHIIPIRRCNLSCAYHVSRESQPRFAQRLALPRRQPLPLCSEDGLVHWCSQQRGYPGIPLQDYSQDHLDREYRSEKSCAPFCTISCVQRVSALDQFREDRHGSLHRFFPDLPASVRLLMWLFLPQGSRRPLLGRAVLRCFGWGKVRWE
jgi:hypothetical protein